MKFLTYRERIREVVSRRPDPDSTTTMSEGLLNQGQPSYKRDTSEISLMFFVGLVSLTVYFLTLSPGVVPGTAAVATGRTLGVLPSLPALHPLWLLVSRAVAAIPVLETVLRLNLFSAICGSLAVAWLFRISKRVFFEFIREAPSVRLVPVGDEDQPKGMLVNPDGDVMEHVYASLGGLVAALAFAFCAPFWIASTSLQTQSFNILFVLFTADLLLCYHYTGRTGVCVAALFLFGLGLVESVIFVTLAPVALVLVILAGIRYGQISESFILLMLAAALAGLAANLGLFTLQSDWGQQFSVDVIFRLLSTLAHAHINELTQGLPKNGWGFILLQTTVPLLITLTSVRGFSSLQDEPTRWKWGVTNIIFSAYAIACLFNLPKTAWCLAREGSHLPMMPCLSIAISAGALFVYWCLVASSGAHTRCYENDAPSFNLRLLGYGLCGLLVIVLFRALHLNLSDADGRKTSLADRIADEMLKQAGPARCLVTDGTLDLNLLIRNRLAGNRLTLLPCSSEPDSGRADKLDFISPFRLALPGTDKSPAPSTATFVADWLRLNSKEHDQVAVVGIPQIWQRAGLTAVPHGLIYSGTDDPRTLDSKALLADNLELWRQTAPRLASVPPLRPELSLIHSRIRALASRMANDLGVLLESRGDTQGAESAYDEALKIDRDNLSSGLNRHGLRLRSRVRGASKEFAVQALALASQPNFFETFGAAVSRYGMLSAQEADVLLPAVLQLYSSGSRPPATMIRLVEKWLGASRSIPPIKSRPIARAANSADLSPDTMLSQALALWLDGQHIKAEKMLRLIVGSRPNNLSAWALLAEVLMTRDHLKEIQEVVLPAMRAILAKTENADGTLVEMTQGCLLMRTVPANPEAARACFKRALSLNPKLTAACDQLLQADRLLGNAAYLEDDSLNIIAHSPDHSGANAILGSLRLGQKRSAEAERYLRQSIKVQPTAATLNDLAELLRQQDKLAEAEQQARLAVRLAPDFYQAWDTLGNILIEAGRPSEAHGPLSCAFALSPNDPRLVLTLTRLHIKEGALREASSVLEQAHPMFSQTAASLRVEYANLKAQLKAQPQQGF